MPREPKPIRWKTLLVLLALALGLGSLYRFTDLAKRPMHTDEAILAMKTQEYWQSGTFEYDPKDYHGPFLHHLTRWIGGMRGWSPESLTEQELRWVAAICGLLVILSPLLLLDVIGRTGAGMASLFLAVSPMMTFYSRYYIMETPFVLLMALFIALMWRWTQKRNHLWLVLAGVVLGLLHATKETFVLNIAALSTGWGIVKMSGLSFAPKQSSLGFGSFSRRPLPWLPGILVIGVAAIVSMWMFSNDFREWQHVKDSVLTYESYLGRSGGVGHEKPWHYYLTLLFWRRQGFIWSEALIGGLAVIGILNACLDNRRADHKRAFLICFSTYTLVLLGIYCAIPYKTPWSIMGVDWALALLAGLGARTIFRAFSEAPFIKMVLAVLLAGGIYNLCHQTSMATDYAFPNETRYASSEPHNPYAYSHTVPSLVQLAVRIHSLAEKHPAGKDMPVQVIQAEQGWPLPWYLRDMKHVGYQAGIPATLDAPVVVTDADKEEPVMAKLGGAYEPSLWGFRSGLTLSLLVEKSLLEAYEKPPAPAVSAPEPPAKPVTATTLPAKAEPKPAAAPPPPPFSPTASPASAAESQTASAPPLPMVPKAELVVDEPELMGPPYPVPAIGAPTSPAPPAR